MNDASNTTHQSDVEELRKVNEALANHFIATDVALVLYIIVGGFGNLLVLYVYVFKMKQRDISNRFLIPYLALGDLLTSVFGSGYSLAMTVNPLNFHGEIRCKLMWFFNSVVSLFACFMLLAIAIQRYMKVCCSHKITSLQLYTYQKIAIVATIVFAVCLSIPVLLFYGEEDIFYNNVKGVTCGPHRTEENSFGSFVYSIILGIAAMFFLSLLTFFYSLIGKTIYAECLQHKERRKKISEASVENHDQNSGRTNTCSSEDSIDLTENDIPSLDTDSNQQAPFNTIKNPTIEKRMTITGHKVWNHFRVYKFTYMYMTVTLVFLVTFSPRLVLMVMEAIDKKFWFNLTLGELTLNLFLYKMYLINHISNPFIYGFYDGTFRRKAIKILRFWK